MSSPQTARSSPVIFLLGPTASGKTALAMHLADIFPVGIVSVDSALVYRGMNIGTAKPDATTLEKYPHHLVDLIDPVDAYSAARFCNDANAAITEIHSQGKTPLLVGGTMLYAKALLEGLSEMPPADGEVRAAIEAEAAIAGWPAMHEQLARVDPVTAQRLNAGDSQRIQRALEVYRISGKPISSLQVRDKQAADFPFFPYRSLKIGLLPGERAMLHERIASRFDGMIAHGLVDEVRRLRKQYALDPAMPSMRCVGYRQAWRFIDGDINASGLRETGVAATRQLAKRQMTWLRSMNDVESFDCLRADLAEAVTSRVKSFLT
ncbi:MAG: tRNA (adenosine(37)-N6)-dimethylallyltransferase MiaA [Betaproteobacteria bacterium]